MRHIVDRSFRRMRTRIVQVTPIGEQRGSRRIELDAIEKIEPYVPDDGAIVHLLDGETVLVSESCRFVTCMLGRDFMPTKILPR